MILALSFIFSACTGPNPNASTTTPSSPKEETATTSKKSLKDLLSMGVAQKCTYSFSDEDTSSEGEILISGNKFKQTTKVSGGNGSMTVSAYSDGQYMYTWNDSVPNSGIKMKIEEPTVSPVESEDMPVSNTVNMEESYNYQCSPAVVSDADFALPSGLNFVDYTKFQQDLSGLDLEELQKQFGN